MTALVLTLTLNPAIDQTITLDALHPGHVHRAQAVRFDAGGKGVNVASCLADWGLPVIATGILGEANDNAFKTLFASKKIVDRFARVPGDTRVNIKLAHDADTTDINLPGLTITPDVLSHLTSTVLGLARPDGLAVLAGSVPAGINESIYRELVAALSTRGARVLLDTSGPPLAIALAEQARHLPFCVKPNRAELEAWAGHPLPDLAAVAETARALAARGVHLVVVSLGADGALFVSAGQALLASHPPVICASTVGAGDAMVAGIVAGLQERRPLADIARLATAFAVGKLGRPGPNLPPRGEIEARAAHVRIVTLGEGMAGA